MIKLPLNGKWTQENSSYKMGQLWYSKNLNFDEAGIVKLSPRMVNIFDDSADTANIADTDFNIPVALGRYGIGDFRVGTTNEPFNLSISNAAKTIAEDASSNNPNMDFLSHACWWQNRWHASTTTAVNYNSAGTWTANAITGLTATVRHYMAVFRNRNSLCVSNGNVLKQYDTSYANTTDLTIPSDFEIIGLAYNNYRMGVITRLGTDSAGQNTESFFFTWDGSSTSAVAGVSIGSYAAISIVAYKSSFAILTAGGELLYWNGGGFDKLAQFPFYEIENRLNNPLAFQAYGDNMIVDGDTILINMGFDFDSRTYKQESYVVNNPSGIWCYDPKVGLYHKYSLSNSRAYLHTITQANVNTTTNILTTSAPIPATGNPLILANANSLGGITRNKTYFVIKLSSTTFSIAETKELAEAGVAIDITSADTNNHLWLYDVLDYGISYLSAAGAVGLMGVARDSFSDIIAGGRILNTALNNQPTMCVAAPFIPNRGYLVSPKLFLDSTTEGIPSLVIKHRTLDVNDEIIVRVKTLDYLNIPTSTPDSNSNSATWTSGDEFYTDADISEAKTAFDAGVELEIEFTAGIGAGQMVKITNIEGGSGTYNVTLEENVDGASAGLKSYFVIDNWKVCASVDSSTQKNGIFEIPIAEQGKAPQFKIEFRGIKTAIEDMFINNEEHMPSGV